MARMAEWPSGRLMGGRLTADSWAEAERLADELGEQVIGVLVCEEER